MLKHKIVDTVRRHAATDSLDDEGEGAAALALCRIEALSAGLRDAMRLRMLEERSTEAVCRELGISEENLFLRIHRARKQLLS